MRFRTMPGRRRDIGVKAHELEPGDFVWVDVTNPDDTHPLGEPYLLYRPPDHDMLYTAFVTTDPERTDKSGTSGTYWWWNGDRDKPTLSPSIGVPATPPYRWHGFLKDGIWKACE